MSTGTMKDLINKRNEPPIPAIYPRYTVMVNRNDILRTDPQLEELADINNKKESGFIGYSFLSKENADNFYRALVKDKHTTYKKYF